MSKNIAYGHGHTFRDCGMQCGMVAMTPTANEVSKLWVEFPEEFAEVPDIVIVSPQTSVPYSHVRYVSANNYEVGGFNLYMYRTSATTTNVSWIAFGKLK